MRLSEFPGIRDKIKFIKGAKNGAADGLSRKQADEPARLAGIPLSREPCLCIDQHRYTPVCMACWAAPAVEMTPPSRPPLSLQGNESGICLSATRARQAADATIEENESHHSPIRLASMAASSTRRLTGISIYAGVGSESLLQDSEVDWIFIESAPAAMEFLQQAGRLVFPSLEVLLSLIESGDFRIPHPDLGVVTPSCKGYSSARLTAGRAPPVPACAAHFANLPALLFRLKDVNMLPDTFMVEMIARPEPKRFESEDSARVGAAFNKVVHGFKQVYGTVHFANHDASDYGSPIAKVHWILQASAIGHLQKMKNRMGGIRNKPCDRLLPGGHPRVQQTYIDYRELTDAPPVLSTAKPSDHGWPNHLDGAIGHKVAQTPPLPAADTEPAMGELPRKGVVTEFVAASGDTEAYLQAYEANHVSWHIHLDEARSLVIDAGLPLSNWQLNTMCQKEFYSQAVRRDVSDSLAQGGASKKSRHLFRVLRRKDHEGRVDDGSSGRDQIKGSYVSCTEFPLTAFTSFASLHSRYYENSRFTNNLILDPMTGKPRSVLPYEVAKLKGWDDRYANYIQDLSETGPQGEIDAWLILANALELDAWQHFVDNLVSCIRSHDAGLEEQAARARNASNRMLQERIHGRSSLPMGAPYTRDNIITAQKEDPATAYLRELVEQGAEDVTPSGEAQKLAKAMFIVDDLLVYSSLVDKEICR